MQEELSAAKDRKTLRRRVRIPCEVVREHDFALVSDVCFDLSPHGMRVRSLSPVELNTPLLVSFRVPDAGVHMDVSARVSRVAKGRRRGERFATLGISFVDLSPLEGAILAARLKGVPPPAPARHLRIDYASSVQAIHSSLARAATRSDETSRAPAAPSSAPSLTV
jgi:hypothetical protein